MITNFQTRKAKDMKMNKGRDRPIVSEKASLSVINFIKEVTATPGGEGIVNCIQCGVCTGSCPVAGKMEYALRQTIAMIRAGMRNEVLSSSSMWYCLSCYTCTVRCPRGVKPAELAHALEALAIQQGFLVKRVDTPAMYRNFASSVKANGRVYELGMMLGFYFDANPLGLVKLLPVAIDLFSYGRLRIRPKRVKGRKELRQIMRRFAEVRGAS